MPVKQEPQKKANKTPPKQRNNAAVPQVSPPESLAEHIIYLQQTVGNQAVQSLIQTGVIHPKLKISQPGDKYEQEADRVAEQVMRMPIIAHTQDFPVIQRNEATETEEPWYRVYEGIEVNDSNDYVVAGISQKIGEKTTSKTLLIKPGERFITPKGWDLDCFIRRDGTVRKFHGVLAHIGVAEELTKDEAKSKYSQYLAQAEELFKKNPPPQARSVEVQRQQSSYTSPQISVEIESYLDRIKGSGQPLPESTRQFYEPRFGVDFSQVRLHTDSRAAETARSINAKAFTVGRDIAFGSGQFAPGNIKGKKLLAHELAHVAQQKDGESTSSPGSGTPMVQLKTSETKGELIKPPEEAVFGPEGLTLTVVGGRAYFNFELKIINVRKEIVRAVEEVEDIEVIPQALPALAKHMLRTMLSLIAGYGTIVSIAWRQLETSLVLEKELLRRRMIEDPTAYVDLSIRMASGAVEKHFTQAFMNLKNAYSTEDITMRQSMFMVASHHFNRAYYIVDLLDALNPSREGFWEQNPAAEAEKKIEKRQEEFKKLEEFARTVVETREALTSRVP